MTLAKLKRVTGALTGQNFVLKEVQIEIFITNL